ncbi:unnamed protein product [Arctogadus glacialis]
MHPWTCNHGDQILTTAVVLKVAQQLSTCKCSAAALIDLDVELAMQEQIQSLQQQLSVKSTFGPFAPGAFSRSLSFFIGWRSTSRAGFCCPRLRLSSLGSEQSH